MKIARTQVRLPKTIHDWIVQSAAKNNRSMNGEIVRMLNEVIQMEQAKQKKA